jgi:hypothetical protein
LKTNPLATLLSTKPAVYVFCAQLALQKQCESDWAKFRRLGAFFSEKYRQNDLGVIGSKNIAQN